MKFHEVEFDTHLEYIEQFPWSVRWALRLVLGGLIAIWITFFGAMELLFLWGRK